MKRLLAVLVLAGASVYAQTITETFGSGANAFSIDFVTIGNPGNAAETSLGPNAGRVDYIYNLGKYEISRDQIEKANTAGDLGIILYDMTDYGGNGSNRPATGISWNEAARFVNYLNISKGYQAAYNFTTSGPNDNITLWETGQYSGTNQYRHKDALYFLPNADEWIKGAYYDPSKNGVGGYWSYPTGGNNAPVAGLDMVFGLPIHYGPTDVTSAGKLSPFGTMAQGGNVLEWNESARDGNNNDASENRVIRGGAWNDGADIGTRLDFMLYEGATTGDGVSVGFRIAMVPEPSSLSLLLAGGAVLMAGRRRIRGQ
jgi:hypothetical protein